jgi:hypothetical protein
MFASVSPLPAATIVFPLTFVLACSMIREAYEDIVKFIFKNKLTFYRKEGGQIK